jgi:PAS domain S-box-containing protein
MNEKLKILHLEDNDLDAELIAKSIKHSSLKPIITCVKKYDEFIEALEHKKFDIVLCDYNLPSFTGIEAMAIVKEKHPELPIIFISGSIGEERAIELLKKGATDYIIKDSPARLAAAISRAMQEAKERKKLREARESLQRSEEQYRNIFENSPVGIYRTTPTGKILAANHALTNMLGYSSFEELSRINLSDERFGADTSRKKFIERIEKYDAIDSLEAVWVKKDGTKIYVLENAKRIRDQDGNTLYYEGTVQNITEKKIAQQIIEKSEKLLNESEEIAKIGTWEVNFVENTETWSQGFYKLLGYKPFSVQPTRDLFLNHIHHKDKENMKKHMKELLERAGSFVSEQRVIRTDGEVRIHAGKGLVEVDKLGKPVRMYGIVQDITEMKEAERQLLAAKEKAEESDKLKSEFLAQISHEIRTPLNAISSIAQLLKEELKERITEDSSVLFNSIDSAVKRLIRTVETILNISTLQTGSDFKLNFTKFNLNRLLNDIVEEFESFAELQRVNLEYSCSLLKPMIMNDEYMISQIFRLLLDNAIKFTSDGNVKINVFEDVNKKINIKITDTGIGISKEFWPHLFRPFSQESTGYSRKYEGSGLGLALVKKYVEIIGADITFYSEKHRGSEFAVSFDSKIE